MISNETRAKQRRRYYELTPIRHEELRQYHLRRKARVRRERNRTDYDKIMREVGAS